MNGSPLIGINGWPVLAVADPDLLSFRVHNCNLSISCLVITCNIPIKSLRSDASMSTLKNIGNTDIAWRLNSLIVEEYSVHLWMRARFIPCEVFVVVECHKLMGEIYSSEGVVWQRCKAQMDVLGPLCSQKDVFHIMHILCKLNCIFEDKHPRLSWVGPLRNRRIVCWRLGIHHFFSNWNSDFGHCRNWAYDSQVPDVCKHLASGFCGIVNYDDRILVDSSSGRPIKRSKMVDFPICSGSIPSSYNCARSPCQLWDHVDPSQSQIIDMTSRAVCNSSHFIFKTLWHIFLCNGPINVKKFDEDREHDFFINRPLKRLYRNQGS